MYILFKVLLCSVLFKVAYFNDVFLITDKGNCITNSSSAIIFNGDIDDAKEGVNPSTIYPIIKTSDINCNFYNKCNKTNLWLKDDWYIKNSYETAEIVTDQRWENFPVIKTPFKKNENLKYIQLSGHLSDFINISISIRIEYEAHIYLCDSIKEPPNSNCYWIILGGNRGKLSKIRKCKKGQITYNVNKFPTDNECLEGLNKTFENFLNKDEWKHFIISKHSDNLKVIFNNKTFLSITDQNFFYIHHIFIHSRFNQGLWKIQKFSFLENRREQTEFTQIGDSIKKKGNICISMFAKTSSQSSLHFRFNQKYLQINTNGSWQNIKICSILNNDETFLFIKREINKNATKSEYYWAIDDVRETHEIEYRSITTSNKNDICQLISLEGSKSLSQQEYLLKDITTEGINCPEYSFGTACISCDILSGYEDCEIGFKYCQKDTNKCYCSAGYRGIDCDEVCPKGTFGHGCLQQSHCLANYYRIDGFCYFGCEEPFTGWYCNKIKEQYFIEPPTVFAIESTSFKIQQDKLAHKGGGDHYYFELSKNNTDDWVRVNDDNISINESKIVDVYGVEASTDYKIRAIIESRNSKSKANKDGIKIKVFSTRCKRAEPPYGLSYNWTNSNKLYLSWYHPNNTNGLLKGFEIIENNKSTYLIVHSEKSRYEMLYDISINENYCGIKTLRIGSDNSCEPGDLIPLHINLPPRDPPKPEDIDTLIFPVDATILISIDTKSIKIDKLIISVNKIEDNILKIVYEEDNFNGCLYFEIGNNNFKSKNLDNPPLEAGTKYVVNLLFINECNRIKKLSNIRTEITTEDYTYNNIVLLASLIISTTIIIICLILLVTIKYRILKPLNEIQEIINELNLIAAKRR